MYFAVPAAAVAVAVTTAGMPRRFPLGCLDASRERRLGYPDALGHIRQ